MSRLIQSDPEVGAPVHSYSAYGLGIRSTMALPELMAAEIGCDLLVRTEADVAIPPECQDAPWYLRTNREREEITFFVRDFALFQLRRGTEVVVTPCAGADERLIQLFMVSGVLPLVLHQRSLLVLHGSAVEIAGGVVAFLGEPGAGKSTMAAALSARGHRIVADDVTAIRVDAQQPLVFPAFPQLKLRADVVECLGCDARSLVFLHASEEKRGYRVPRALPAAPVPLRGIYVLTHDAAPQVETETLGLQAAMLELTRHAMCSFLLPSDGSAAHFAQCSRLLGSVSVCRLKRFQQLSSLPDLAQWVEHHATRALAHSPD